MSRVVVLTGGDAAARDRFGRRLVDRLQADGLSASWHPDRSLAAVRAGLDRVARARGRADRTEQWSRAELELLEAALKVGDWSAELDPPGADVRVLEAYRDGQPADTRWARALLAALPAPDVVVSFAGELDDDERLREVTDQLLPGGERTCSRSDRLPLPPSSP